MKKNFFASTAWRGITSMFGILFTFVLIASMILNYFVPEINVFMHTSSYEVIAGDGETEHYKSKYDTLQDLLSVKEALNIEIQEEGSVLLKNNGALPLAENERNITLLGVSSVNPGFCGKVGGAAMNDLKQALNIKTSFEVAGLTVNPKMWDWYLSCPYITESGLKRNVFTRSSIYAEMRIGEAPVSSYPDDNGFAEYNGAAVVVITRQGIEGSDLASDPTVGTGSDGAFGITDGDGIHNALQLHQQELDVIDLAISEFDKVIVLINSDNAMELQPLEELDGVDAILWIGSPGARGFIGVGNILTGAVSPSGRLVDAYPQHNTSMPALVNFGNFIWANEEAQAESNPDEFGSAASGYIVEKEGIYVGYKYYETRYEDTVLGQGNASDAVGASSDVWRYEDEMTYPFGYGLSYTTFEEKLDKVSYHSESGIVTATVTVRNTGNVAGKDVVELYMQSPYTRGGIEKAAIQLAAFAKTAEIAPAGSETVTIDFDMRYGASYDYQNAKTYVIEAGDYYFAIGSDSHDALNNILAAKRTTGVTVDTARMVDAAGNSAEGDPDKVYRQTFSYDDKTYATSVTGYEITNRLDFADLNSYDGYSVTYLSRADWSGTWPTPEINLTANAEMINAMKGHFYEAGEADENAYKAGSTDTSYTFAEMYGRDYNDPVWEDLIDQLTFEELTEFIASSRTEIRALPSISFNGTYGRDGAIGIGAQYSAAHPELTGTNEYGYAYADMWGTTMNSQVVQAATWSEDLMTRLGDIFADDGIWTTYSWQRSPGCNMHRTPFTGRSFEYLSEDSMHAFYISAWICKAAEERGMIMSPKHLAFNDQDTNRRGLSTFFNEQAAREIYLRAFEGPFVLGNASATMTSFNRVGCVMSPLCYELQTEILRNEWGFDGLNISDFNTSPILMRTREFLAAGSQTYCAPSATAFTEGENAPLTEAALKADAKYWGIVRERVHEMLYTYVNSIALNGHAATSQVVPITPWWQTAVKTATVVLGAMTACAFLVHICAVLVERRKKT